MISLDSMHLVDTGQEDLVIREAHVRVFVKRMAEYLWAGMSLGVMESDWWGGETARAANNNLLWFTPWHRGCGSVQYGIVWYGTWWGKKYPIMVQTTLFTNWFAHMWCCYPFLSWTHLELIIPVVLNTTKHLHRYFHSDWDPVPHCLSYFLFVSLDRLSPEDGSGILGSEQSQDLWPVIQGSPDLTQASFNLCDLLSTSATNSFPHFEFYRLCCSLFVSFGQFKLTCCCGVIFAFKWCYSQR